jgi:DNA-binding LacI/PurR family transcriptional regulator
MMPSMGPRSASLVQALPVDPSGREGHEGAGGPEQSRRPAAGRVTIQQVAEAAGVSIATVSRAMRRSGTVRPDLAGRVLRAAEDLGYQPSAAAQGLATGVTGMVGVIVPSLANPYFYDIIKAMNDAASIDGYRMLIADAGEDPGEEVALARGFERQVDATVLVSPRMPESALHALGGRSHPVVLVNRAEIGVGLPSVAVDNRAAMFALAGHLATLGHRRVAYLAGPSASWQQGERWRALEQASAFGLEVSDVPAGASIADGYAATDAALELRPTAIMCFDDLVAFGALSRLRDLGVEVPGAVSLTGFDDIELARFARPPLTTAVSPQREIGRHAWRLARRLLAGERPSPEPLLPVPIVVRASTAPPGRPRGGAGAHPGGGDLAQDRPA